MKKYTDKSRSKRIEERKDLPNFYKKHVDNIRINKLCCNECGIKLLGDVSEVAHILNKSIYKSVSTNDNNVIYLCGWKQNNCHANFDSGKEKEMKVFPMVKEKFKNILEEVLEKINHKIWDKYN